MLENEWETLKFFNDNQKLYIKITLFGDRVQAETFVAEHKKLKKDKYRYI